MSGYIGSLSPDYVCPLKCMYFFLCFYYSVYMLPITLSYFWYQSWVLCWVPNGSNVFGFLLGWLLGLFAVFSLFGLIRMIFSFIFLSCLRALSLTHYRTWLLSLCPASAIRLWVVYRCTLTCSCVPIPLVYGWYIFIMYLVISSTVFFSLPSAYVSGLRLRTQIT